MRHPINEKMSVTRLDILQYVLTIPEIGKEEQNILMNHGVNLVIKILNSVDEAYQYLVDK